MKTETMLRSTFDSLDVKQKPTALLKYKIVDAPDSGVLDVHYQLVLTEGGSRIVFTRDQFDSLSDRFKAEISARLRAEPTKSGAFDWNSGR